MKESKSIFGIRSYLFFPGEVLEQGEIQPLNQLFIPLRDKELNENRSTRWAYINNKLPECLIILNEAIDNRRKFKVEFWKTLGLIVANVLLIGGTGVLSWLVQTTTQAEQKDFIKEFLNTNDSISNQTCGHYPVTSICSTTITNMTQFCQEVLKTLCNAFTMDKFNSYVWQIEVTLIDLITCVGSYFYYRYSIIKNINDLEEKQKYEVMQLVDIINSQTTSGQDICIDEDTDWKTALQELNKFQNRFMSDPEVKTFISLRAKSKAWRQEEPEIFNSQALYHP